MKVYCATDVGCVRTLNEDSYYMPAAGESFMAVADGMGGHLAGEVASSRAIEVLTEVLRSENAPGEERLRYAYSRANREVYLESERDSKKRGMGTTLTTLWFAPDSVILAHVGDSRAYRMRNGKIERMSVDHSYVEELVRSGAITPEMALSHPQRNIITRSIGPWPRVETDISTFDLLDGDVWLLCSDGLTKYLRDEEIEETLKSSAAWNEKVSILMKTCLQRGGADNITVLIAVMERDTNE